MKNFNIESVQTRLYIYRIIAAIITIVLGLNAGIAITEAQWLELALAVLGLTAPAALGLAARNTPHATPPGEVLEPPTATTPTMD